MRLIPLSCALVLCACGPVLPEEGAGGDPRAGTKNDQPSRDGGAAGPDGGRLPPPPPRPQPDAGAGTAPDAQTCGAETFRVDPPPPPDVLVVFDRSGSMANRMVAGATLWQVMRTALKTVVMNLQNSMQFGLALFPSDSGCGFATGIDVPVAAANYGAIATKLDATEAAGGTPTRGAMRVARDYMAALQTPRAKKAILLVTDGEPNCAWVGGCRCPDGYTPSPSGTACCRNGQCSYFCEGGERLDDLEAAAVCAESAQAGIPVYVIGMAQGLEASLNRLALAGGAPRNPGPPYYYEATSPTALEAAMNDIARQIIPCSFTLDRAPPAPDDVVVTLGGLLVPRSDANGWSLGADLRTVTFTGSYCEQLQRLGGSADIGVTFNCPPIGKPR